MTDFEKIDYYFNVKGIYKIRHLDIFLAKGILTRAQYDEIVGKRV